MQKGDVVLRVLLPTDEDAPKAVHPGMSTLNYPAAGALAGFDLDGFGFFTPGADMGGKAKLAEGITDFLKVVCFIQTHALRVL